MNQRLNERSVSMKPAERDRLKNSVHCMSHSASLVGATQ